VVCYDKRFDGMITKIEPRTAVIPLDEYERLKESERLYQELLRDIAEDKATIMISSYGGFFSFNRHWIKNPDNMVMILEGQIKDLKQQLDSLKETPMPMFNFTRKKVKDLTV
jgi:hypothetical protein